MWRSLTTAELPATSVRMTISDTEISSLQANDSSVR
jgi:hypothetical protein